MNQFQEFFNGLTDTTSWPPRWKCGYWTDLHGWMYIAGEAMTWLAYFIIPIIIVHYFVTKRQLKFPKVYILFAAFILLCGATHFMDAMMFWIPMYRLNALLRVITGVVSLFTAFYLKRILKLAVYQKTSTELEAEAANRHHRELELFKANFFLKQTERLAQVGSFEWSVIDDKLVWSNNMYNIYGLAIGTPITRAYVRTFTHPDDQVFQSEQNAKMNETKTYVPYKYRLIRTDGEIRWLRVNGEVMLNADGEVERVLGGAVDVTDMVEMEEELRHKTKELEQSNRGLETFAFVASHDMREPLRKISVFSKLAMKNKEVMPPESVSYINKIGSASKRMQRVMDDILEISTINRVVELQPQVINPIIQGAIHDLEMKINDKGGVINVQDNMPSVMGNESYLRQIFVKLINNSLKFCSETPVIDISAKEVDSMVRFTIVDNGIGMDHDYLIRIFNPFQRINNKAQYEGSGLGLSYVKTIVDLHNGSIWVESEKGKGSKFHVQIPKAV